LIVGDLKAILNIHIGSPERVAGLTRGQDSDVVALKVEQFGAIWLANQIDREVNLCGIVDSIVTSADRETGPSIGEYFLYSVFNRMVQSVSKPKQAARIRRDIVNRFRAGNPHGSGGAERHHGRHAPNLPRECAYAP
jgi:hypothetical protein